MNVRFLIVKAPTADAVVPGWANSANVTETVDAEGDRYLLLQVNANAHHAFVQLIPPTWDVVADWREDNLSNAGGERLSAIAAARGAP